ncbi:hypothetical protein A5821_003429 [Enterococcus sp. 7F3_DIV0205]|uniref:Uncharacterized protein n=1 Tax=Candidatus Enterococcus palustris TaxID=1834189 RepID=A0AAQ3WFW0_9ENTE|nr:hypothetical protein [Enterococcus sp. 7F3_DIV0205]OTN84311.1 hypothetical protein A5821_000237 [Enterococcus sp. 7F3_DIV0205]
MWQFIKNNLFMIKRDGLLYNMKPRNTFFLTLFLGATGIPRILNRDFISGGILLFLFIFVFSNWDSDIIIMIGLFEAVTSLFYREPEPKKQAVEDKHKVTRSAVTKEVQKETENETLKKTIKVGNKICHFCGAPMPSNETVCSYCRMESTQ